MKPLPNRKTPLQSKRNVVAMMNLFESKIDEKIISINLSQGTIQGEKHEYRIDFKKNNVKVMFQDPWFSLRNDKTKYPSLEEDYNEDENDIDY